MNQREASRKDWRTDSDAATVCEINAGSLQRIADATELMAKQYADLLTDRDHYKRSAEFRQERIDGLIRQRSALRGVITRLKRRRKR